MHSCESHNRDGDRGARHVDGRAEGDGYGIELFVEAEALAQVHIDGDVSRRGAGEERGHAAFLQAPEHQRIRVLADDDEGHDGVYDERRDQHAADEDQQQLAVLGEDGKAAGGNRGEYQTEDAEGRKVNNKAHGLGDGLGRVGEELLGRVGRGFERKAENDCPEQNAEVVAGNYGAYRVCNDVVEKSGEDGSEAVGRFIGGSVGEGDAHGEDKACHNSDGRGEEGGEEVQHYNGAELLAHLFSRLRQRADDKYEHQQRRNCLQRADKQLAEDADAGCGVGRVGDKQRKRRADDHADNYAQHEAHAVICFYDFHLYLSSFDVNYALICAQKIV